MRAAVVEDVTNIVLNIIIADAEKDPAPEGCFLIDVTYQQCDIGWIYDPSTGQFNPPPTPPEPEV